VNTLLTFGELAFERIWKISLSAAILVVLVFLAQKLLSRWLTPRFRQALSLLIFIRLLLPAVPSSPLSLENLSAPWSSPKRPASLVAASTPSGEQARPPRLGANVSRPSPGKVLETEAVTSSHSLDPIVLRLSVLDWISMTWACGCLCLVAFASWRYWRWNGLIARGRPITDPRLLALLDDARATMGVRRSVKLIAMTNLDSPAVFGVRRVSLLLPENATAQLSAGEMRLVFLHEMAHIRRHDLGLNVLLMAVHFLHWFNPLVWLATHRIRADGELVCDDMVMNSLVAAERPGYGQLLLRLIEEFRAETPAFPGGIHVVSSKQEIKRRLIMIKNHRSSGLGGGLVTALAVTSLVCATYTRAQDRVPIASKAPFEASNVNDSSGANARVPDQPGAPSQLGRDMIGTWVLIGKPGQTGKAPASGGRYKFFTGSRWCITQADPDNHVVIFNHGGDYWFDGNEYVEAVDYANPSTLSRIGRTNHFQVKIEGDELTDIGIGKDNQWREVWKRVGTRGESIAKPQPGAGLIGAWKLEGEPNAFKFITDSSWCDTTVDSRTKVVVFHHGGACALKGNRYVQHVEYANPTSMNLIGHSSGFDIKLDGDTLNIVGVGNPWNQVWTRVK
jgi:beta-lactamase regulating signal transducer with metallopeptidase domain